MLDCVLFGLRIRFSFFFFAVLTGMTLIDRTGVAPVAFCACALHELGHLAAFLCLRVKPQALCFEATGLRLVQPKKLLSLKQELFVLSAGCAVNLLLGAACWRFLPAFSLANLTIGGFNLLPVLALDGGKLLYTLFCFRLQPATARRIVGALSCVCLLPLTILGGLLFARTRNLTLLLTTLYLSGLLLFKSSD